MSEDYQFAEKHFKLDEQMSLRSLIAKISAMPKDDAENCALIMKCLQKLKITQNDTVLNKKKKIEADLEKMKELISKDPKDPFLFFEINEEEQIFRQSSLMIYDEQTRLYRPADRDTDIIFKIYDILLPEEKSCLAKREEEMQNTKVGYQVSLYDDYESALNDEEDVYRLIDKNELHQKEVNEELQKAIARISEIDLNIDEIDQKLKKCNASLEGGAKDDYDSKDDYGSKKDYKSQDDSKNYNDSININNNSDSKYSKEEYPESLDASEECAQEKIGENKKQAETIIKEKAELEKEKAELEKEKQELIEDMERLDISQNKRTTLVDKLEPIVNEIKSKCDSKGGKKRTNKRNKKRSIKKRITRRKKSKNGKKTKRTRR